VSVWNRTVEEMVVVQMVKRFHLFLETERFITLKTVVEL
jgi:hypothetical protein